MKEELEVALSVISGRIETYEIGWQALEDFLHFDPADPFPSHDEIVKRCEEIVLSSIMRGL